MKLDKKKALAARALGVGMKRIWFNPARLSDIKEVITKQDIRDLLKDKAIMIREVKGKLKQETSRKRGEGKIKKSVRHRKRDYVLRIRKLRRYLKYLKNSKRISREDYLKLRRNAKSGMFATFKHLKENFAQEKGPGRGKGHRKMHKQKKAK